MGSVAPVLGSRDLDGCAAQITFHYTVCNSLLFTIIQFFEVSLNFVSLEEISLSSVGVGSR